MKILLYTSRLSLDSEMNRSRFPQLFGLKSLDALGKGITKCSACVLRNCNRVVPYGDSKRVMLLPFSGKLEALTKSLLADNPVGYLLKKYIATLGFVWQDFHFTTVVKCSPRDEMPPEMESFISCSIILQAEMDLIQPSTIVAVGQPTIDCLFGKGTIDIRDINDSVVKASYRGKPVLILPVFHPFTCYLEKDVVEKQLMHLSRVKLVMKDI